MVKLLSLRLCEHDSNISYYDGKNIKYIKTERKFNIKHHTYNNIWHWESLTKKLWNVDCDSVDEIAIVFDPWIHNFPQYTPPEFFFTKKFEHLRNKKCTRVGHHYAHALSLELVYPHVKKHVVIDGSGDADQAVSVICNDKYLVKYQVSKEGSLGEMYDTLAKQFVYDKYGLGAAGKFMGLQSYGNKDEAFIEKMINKKLNNIRDVFNFQHWIDHKKDQVLAEISKIDYARSVHEIAGEILLKFFKDNFDATDHIGFTGGVALNVIWNEKLKNYFKNLYLVPHCTDEGLSLGGLKYLLDKHSINYKLNNFPFIQSDECAEEITQETADKIAEALTNNKLVALYQKNGEVGPRALGHRSFLFNPFVKNAKEIVNKVKLREQYRPFGASVLKEDQDKYFYNSINNPYMLYAATVKVNNLYGVTHIDGSCRYQTVENGPLYKVLKSFKKKTGESILLNTSLNLSGNPLMGSFERLKRICSHPDVNVVVLGDEILKYD